MVYVKSVIITTIALILLLVGYMIFSSRSSHTSDRAYEAFARGDSEQALKSLSEAADELPPDRLQLYLGYIYRAKEQWPQSDSAFANAERLAKHHQAPTLMLEIALNQALNAYLQGGNDQLDHAISEADAINEENSWLEFFKGLDAYQKEKYGLALNIWKSTDRLIPLSSWMRQAFEEVFTPEWILNHTARSQIETGHFLAARQMLEEAMKRPGMGDLSDIDFLIGLSYFKEAKTKPLNSAAPDFKLAATYFNKIPENHPDFIKEQPRLIAHVKAIVQSLVASRNFTELAFYTDLLASWHAEDELNEINQQLIKTFNQELDKENSAQVRDLANLLQRMIPEGPKRQVLQQALQESATRALNDSELSKAMNLWELSQKFSKDPTATSRLFTNKTVSQVLTRLGSDSADLKNSTPYLTFWMNVETDPTTRLKFANRLLSLATETLQSQGNPEKALSLYRVALKIPSENDLTIRKDVVTRLSTLYSQALEKDAIQDLPSIYLVINALNLKEIDIQRQMEIPKQLTAAEAALAKGDYAQAIRRARWVSVLDPNNQAARLIAGRVLYWQADYDRALQYLSGVNAPDLEILEAIAVSQILSGSEAEGNNLLDGIRKKRPLHSESIERIGLGLMALGQYAKGEFWLKQIEEPSAEVLIGLAYSAIRQQKWEEATAMIHRIPAEDNHLESVQGMMILTDIALNKPDDAEKRLLALLARRGPNDSEALAPAYLQFEQKVLQPFNRYAIAGYFFKEVKQQPEIALKYLSMIKEPAPETRYLKGELLMALGKASAAVPEFQQAYAESLDQNVKMNAMPQLAQALAASGKYIEAFGWYRRFFQEQNDHLKYREDYARLLMTLKRYDLAIEQFNFMRNRSALTPTQTVSYVNSLLENGDFDDTKRVGELALSPKSELNIAQKLNVAKAMIIINHQESTWPLLKQLPPDDKLTDDETVALLQFLMEIGSYAQATSLANNKRESLKQSPNGLLAMAELYLRLGQTEEAVNHALAAVVIDPENPTALEFIANHTTDTQRVRSELQNRTALINDHKISPTAITSYARAVITLSWLSSTQAPDPMKSDQKRALSLLNIVNKENPDIPEVLFLIGELQALQLDPTAATESYVNAARLSPSYTQALLHLGQLYRQQKDPKHAIATFYQVTKYEPDNALAWEALAELYAADGYLYEASMFYQNAIQFRPNRIQNYLALANVFLELRSPENAQKFLSHASKIDPDNVTVIKLLLLSLYDSAFEASPEDRQQVEGDRQTAVEALKRLAPTEADQFLLNLQKNHGGTSNPILPDIHIR